MDERAVAELLDRLDLGALPACPMCLFDVAWAIRAGKPRRAIAPKVAHAADWTWEEIEDELRAALRRLAMRGVAAAEVGLADLDRRGFRSPLVRAVVERLATIMAEEMAVSRPF